MITKTDLDQALKAWETAKDTSLYEQKAMDDLVRSHSTLIASLRSSGHTWNQAQSEFDRLLEGHRTAVFSTFDAMDERCREYRELLRKFNSQ